MTTNNRPTVQARDAQIIVGVHKNLQNVPSLPLGGAALTPDELVKLVQSRIDLAHAIGVAKANWLAQLDSGKALNAKLSPVVKGLRQYVINAFGEASPVLADFGFTAPKKRVLTPEQKAAAAAKAKATRAARHTMGKVQKKDVKGTVATAAPQGDAITVPAPTPSVAATPTPAVKPAS